MNLALLDELKAKLVHGKDFGAVWEYFLDHFGENKEFLDIGRRRQDEMLEQILAQMTVQIFGKESPVKDLILVGVPDTPFIHGGCILGGKAASLIYFEDVQVGLLAIVWSFVPTETKLVRFSPRPLVRLATPSVN